MTSPKIDDAMVERAARAFAKLDGEWTTHEEQVRVILKAALSPAPEEPEIPVTERMLNAAMGTVLKDDIISPGLFAKSYRAMERAMLNELAARDERGTEDEPKSLIVLLAEDPVNGLTRYARQVDRMLARTRDPNGVRLK